jgi:hypothetical protein
VLGGVDGWQGPGQAGGTRQLGPVAEGQESQGLRAGSSSNPATQLTSPRISSGIGGLLSGSTGLPWQPRRRSQATMEEAPSSTTAGDAAVAPGDGGARPSTPRVVGSGPSISGKSALRKARPTGMSGVDGELLTSRSGQGEGGGEAGGGGPAPGPAPRSKHITFMMDHEANQTVSAAECGATAVAAVSSQQQTAAIHHLQSQAYSCSACAA